MRTVQVAFPVMRGKYHFRVEKGRRWSIVEHLLLNAVCAESASAEDLAKRSALPRRVVIEAFVRLMRAGLAEIVSRESGIEFQVTPLGLVQSKLDELPSLPLIQYKWLGFNIDQVTGMVFRGRELRLVHPRELGDAVIKLDPSTRYAGEDLGDVYAALEGEDEVIVGMKPSTDRLVRRFAVVSVSGDKIEGLPSRAAALRDRIITAAKADRSVVGAVGERVVEEVVAPPDVQQGIFDQNNDLIIDGKEHKSFLSRSIRQARERVLIHSTFLSFEHATAILPDLLGAASRGVRIDIFWGQDEDRKKEASSRVEAEKLRAAIAEAGRSDAIVIHPFTTGSHSKIVVADNGQGRWFASLGSCNWLSSSFDSFEVSVRVRDPHFCGRIIRHLATLSTGRETVANTFASELTVLGRKVQSLNVEAARRVPMRILLAADHAGVALEGAQKAQRRLFVTSHRIGVAGRPNVIIPALAAARTNRISARLYFGRGTSTLTGSEAGSLSIDLGREGVQIRPVHTPRLHAKLLAWDDDSIAITSQNWLSADPSDSAPLREIGMFIEAPRLADRIIRIFDQQTSNHS